MHWTFYRLLQVALFFHTVASQQLRLERVPRTGLRVALSVRKQTAATVVLKESQALTFCDAFKRQLVGQPVCLYEVKVGRHFLDRMRARTNSTYAATIRSLRGNLPCLKNTRAPLIWRFQPLWQQVGTTCLEVIQETHRNRCLLASMRNISQDQIELDYSGTLQTYMDV